MPVNLPTHKISKNLLRIVEAVETLENSVLMKKILSANIADKLNVTERSSKVWDGTQITLAASYDSSPSKPELTTIGCDNKTTLKRNQFLWIVALSHFRPALDSLGNETDME